MDTPRNNILPASWESISPGKLTTTVNYSILNILALDQFSKSKAAHKKVGGGDSPTSWHKVLN